MFWLWLDLVLYCTSTSNQEELGYRLQDVEHAVRIITLHLSNVPVHVVFHCGLYGWPGSTYSTCRVSNIDLPAKTGTTFENIYTCTCQHRVGQEAARHEAQEPLSAPHLASGYPSKHQDHIPSCLACHGYNHKGHTPCHLACHRYSHHTRAQQRAEIGDHGEAVNDGWMDTVTDAG